jgi:hypothetical protein
MGAMGGVGRGRRRLLALVMAAGMATAAGCARQQPETDITAEPVGPTRLLVQNQAFLDMTIYVYRNSQRIRLGQASGNGTTRFTIPASLIFGATPLRFQADPIGGRRTPVTSEITVTAGDEVVLTIPPS